MKDRNFGDRWTYTAIRSNSRLFLSHFGGKRTETTCAIALNLMFTRLQLPTPDDPIIVATDGNPQYAEALAQLYPGFPVTPNELDQFASLSSTKSQLLFKITEMNLHLVICKYITRCFELLS